MFKFANFTRKKVSPLIKHFSKKPARRTRFTAKSETSEKNPAAAAAALLTAEVASDPAIIKLIEYAKDKKTLSYEELSDFLPEHITNSDKIEQVLALLEVNNVQLVEDDGS